MFIDHVDDVNLNFFNKSFDFPSFLSNFYIIKQKFDFRARERFNQNNSITAIRKPMIMQLKDRTN